MRQLISVEQEGLTTVTISKRSDGFVLVAVIWVLAAMGLVVAFIGVQLEEMQNQSIAMEAKRVREFDRLAIESVALYLASTRTASYRGLHTDRYTPPPLGSTAFLSTDGFVESGDELTLDGRPYKVRGGLILSIQDAGSLVSLRAERSGRLGKLLKGYGLPPSDIQRLLATLSDYIDRDEIPSLNGAESSDYERVGRTPPTNRFLVHPGQLHNILGWDRVDQMPGFLEEVTIYVAGRENYNTMTPRAMKTFYLQESDVERVLTQRKDKSFTRLNEILEVTGELFERDPLAVTFLPSRYLILKIESPNRISGQKIGVTLTPDSNLAPWEIDYREATNSLEQEYDSIASVEPKVPPTILLR